MGHNNSGNRKKLTVAGLLTLCKSFLLGDQGGATVGGGATPQVGVKKKNGGFKWKKGLSPLGRGGRGGVLILETNIL